MSTQMKLIIALALAAFFANAPVLANESHCQQGIGENRASTPASAFELLRDGSVIQRQANVQWAQCALGQTWNRSGCDGRALAFDWDGATRAIAEFNSDGGLAGHADWRLPTRTELEAIVEKCREAPAINEIVFPNTPWAGFWSSDIANDEHAWFVGFYYGLPLEYSRSASYRVRPIRDR
jgi:hypothetical protein